MPSANGALHRLAASLTRSLGPVLGRAIADGKVVEMYRNPDGSVWTERLGEGCVCVANMSNEDAAAIIRLVASHMQREVHGDTPLVSGTLPGTGDRFQGVMPPLVESPVFTIRKRAVVRFTLDDYVASGTLDEAWAAALRRAVAKRRNVLVVGGTGSGKTTLVNALLAELGEGHSGGAGCRAVLIEDTRELQCPVKDTVSLLTKDTTPRVGMRDLVRATLRLRPDRIIIGEVRGPEALDLLKAWNTGHPGGISTLHANSAVDALHRLEDLIGEAVTTVPRRAIASALDLIVFIARDVDAPSGRRVRELLRVEGWDDGPSGYQLTPVEPAACAGSAV